MCGSVKAKLPVFADDEILLAIEQLIFLKYDVAQDDSALVFDLDSDAEEDEKTVEEDKALPFPRSFVPEDAKQLNTIGFFRFKSDHSQTESLSFESLCNDNSSERSLQEDEGNAGIQPMRESPFKISSTSGSISN